MSNNIFSITLTPSLFNIGSGIRRSFFGGSIESYTHTNTAIGGYNTSQINVKIKQTEIESFMILALGGNIEIFTDETEKVWEGFINEISVTYNGIDLSTGPLTDTANRVLVKYSEYSTGQPGVTTYESDTISQLRYGMFTKILSSSTVSSTNATNIRDNYLKENRFPKTEMNLSLQESGTLLTVSLTCLGYYHLLENYVYNKSVGSSVVWTVREKIVDVLASDPQGLFNRYGLINSNSLSVAKSENEDRNAWDIIKELVALGDATDNDRMIFGLYNDLSIVYKKVNKSVNYFYKSSTNNKYIRDNQNNKINIAALKAGQYIAIEDLPDVLFSDIDSVSRNIFIESLTYTAPFGLTITGTKLSTLSQKLAKLGISGI